MISHNLKWLARGDIAAQQILFMVDVNFMFMVDPKFIYYSSGAYIYPKVFSLMHVYRIEVFDSLCNSRDGNFFYSRKN